MNGFTSNRLGSSSSLLELLTVGAVAWGALSFGAVYPWTYWPLLTAAAGIGVWGLAGGHRSTQPFTPFLIACACLVGAIACQLIPIPSGFIAWSNPARDRILSLYDFKYATARTPHPLSINPSQTALALGCASAFALFCAGCAKRLTTRLATRALRAITVLG